MKKNKKIRSGLMAVLISVLLSAGSVYAQSGSNRIELQRHDLNVPGLEVVQVVVSFSQGETSPRHKHPGAEIIYVLEGSLEYQVEGRQPVRVEAGGVLFIPNGLIHAAKNVGSSNAKELATYIVEKNKPLVTIVQ